MALYENDLICIFMNINENFKNYGKTIELKNVPTCTKNHISAATHSRTLHLVSIQSLDIALLLDGQKCKLSHFHNKN